MLIFALLIWEFAVTGKDQAWVLRGLLVGMFVPLLMAFGALHGISHIEAEEGLRFTGGGHDLNYLAYMYSASVLIAVYLATNSLPLDRYCRWFYWGTAVLCALGNVLTGSRGGFISLAAAAVFAVVLAVASRRRMLMILQVLVLVVFVYVLVRYIVPAALLERVTQEQSLGEDPRIRIWSRGLAAFWQNPVLGVGAGAYGPATTPTGERLYVAHNAFISVLVELGIVGFALYLTYIGMLFRAAWRLPRRDKLLWLGIMVVWFLNANSAGSQNDKFSWFLHAMVLVQAAACTRPSPLKRPPPYPNRGAPVVRGPMPRLGRP